MRGGGGRAGLGHGGLGYRRRQCAPGDLGRAARCGTAVLSAEACPLSPPLPSQAHPEVVLQLSAPLDGMSLPRLHHLEVYAQTREAVQQRLAQQVCVCVGGGAMCLRGRCLCIRVGVRQGCRGVGGCETGALAYVFFYGARQGCSWVCVGV